MPFWRSFTQFFPLPPPFFPAAYASLKPNKYIVGVSIQTAAGQAIEQGPACVVGTTSDCADGGDVPMVNVPDRDSVVITWSLNATAGAVVNASSTLTIRACYAPASSVDRPWRKAQPIIGKDFDKNCNIKVAVGVDPALGKFVFTPTDKAASALYNIEVLEMCEGGLYCAMGKSVATYGITAVDGRPTWLLACSFAFMGVGPFTLIAFFVYEKKIKKSV
jgi:hypothetical protein